MCARCVICRNRLTYDTPDYVVEFLLLIQVEPYIDFFGFPNSRCFDISSIWADGLEARETAFIGNLAAGSCTSQSSRGRIRSTLSWVKTKEQFTHVESL